MSQISVIMTYPLIIFMLFLTGSLAEKPVIFYQDHHNYDDFIKELFKEYNGQQDPIEYKSINSSTPIKVNVTVHIATFSDISVKTMDYKVDMYLTQEWYDERLRFQGLSEISLYGNYLDKVWLPDTFFSNSKAAHMHDVTKPNKIMRVYPDGKIFYNQRIKVTFGCQMDLRWYPVDIQLCSIFVLSFAYPANKMIYNTSERSISMSESDWSSGQFQYPDYEVSTTTVKHGGNPEKFSTIAAHFALRRLAGFYIVNCYLPFVCITMISMLSPWITVTALPARATIGVVTILSIVVHNSGLQSKMAVVSYMKVMDLYMLVSLLIVLLSLLEFIAAHQLHLRDEKRAKKKAQNSEIQTLIQKKTKQA